MGPIKTVNIGVPVLPIDGVVPAKKLSEQKLAENLNIGRKKRDRIYRRSQNGRSRVAKLSLDNRVLVENQRRGLDHSHKCCSERQNVKEKREPKCSTKWVSYGGSIPLILRALETVNDLNEALKPWEESLNNKERSIILKEQSNSERALEIFEWFKRKGCYELNVIHYNIMLRILGKSQRWDQVENLWDEMEQKRITPTNSTYGTLIDVYSKGGLKEEALCWLDKMYKQGLQPDEVTMGIVVQTYKKAGQFEKAEQFFKSWSSGKLTQYDGRLNPTDTFLPQKCHSSYTYNTLIDTYGKAGQLKEASDTFARMLREGVALNTVTFNTMMHICGNHDRMDEVAALMMKMEEVKCPPDTRTYNILISLHAKHDNINEAASYFTKMKADGLEPDVIGYRTLLYAFSIRHMVKEAEVLVSEMDDRGLEVDEYTQSALTRMYINAGMLGRSWSWFKRFHLDGKMSSECYSANIDAFGECGHLMEAEKVFLCCQEKRKLTVMEFNVMIKAYGIAKIYDKACDLFDDMENHGVSPDKCTYNSLIQILSSAELPHQAKLYLGKMQEAGFVNDCIPYCAVMSSFVKLGQLTIAEVLFKEMLGYAVRPDIIVFGILINAFAEVGSVKEAMNYVEAMKSAGFSGNSVIYNSLIKLYTKVGYLQDAQETYKLLQSSDEGPDVYSSNCMIELYSERAMVRWAEEIFEYLKQRGEANEFSFAMMLCMYKKVGRFGEAVAVAHEMNERGLLTDLLSYNNVIGLYALDGRLKEAAETFHMMIDSGIQPDDSTFRSLGVILVKCGAPKVAVNQLELARRKDAASGISAWISTLCSLLGVDDDALKSCNKTKCPFEFDSIVENGSMELSQWSDI
ncbi:pentatricopeptide repeat-containing protein At3g23020 [Magnolia sinica]|uniref:pentatricopeptide repeat-containing protein At3g23020 n=1 Tax=Magnolia sinica TaxID=86752 RepID=UPI00265936A0|nr:pentatricopeptide repeat-containing protein At3g23020 [Magnolia sinica]XP_058105444.1 pentatricopeptide repeat-containing protein At3g23020 [Magnolia sinica]